MVLDKLMHVLFGEQEMIYECEIVDSKSVLVDMPIGGKDINLSGMGGIQSVAVPAFSYTVRYNGIIGCVDSFSKFSARDKVKIRRYNGRFFGIPYTQLHLE